MNLKDIQLEYHHKELKLEDLAQNPNEQVSKWVQEMIDSNITYPNAATLATVSKKGIPASRVVLIKDISSRGLVFYTNYESAKAQEIKDNQIVSLSFFWKEADRQIRITAKATKTSYENSNEYFLSRSHASQINAIASPQSQKISKEDLEKKVKLAQESYEEIKCPPFWGGYLLEIISAEFWQGRPNRLHDRFLYEKEKDVWQISRLAP